MSDKSLFEAIERRDLRAVAEMLTGITDSTSAGLCSCGKILEPLAVFHGIGCSYRVQHAADLRVRLSLEQRDEPVERYSNIDEESGMQKSGPL